MAQLEHIPCPLCTDEGPHVPVEIPDEDAHIRGYGEIYAGLEKSEWKSCRRCGFVHQNPRPSIATLDAYYLAGEYHVYPQLPDPKALLEIHTVSYRDEIDFALQHSGIRTGNVFDIGCGWGTALTLWRERGFTPYGVEPDPLLFAFAQREYRQDLIQNRVLDGTIELGVSIDLAFSHHALEHVADLDAVMTGLKKVLRVGGYVFTALPTYFRNRSTMSKLWMNSAHYSMFTVRSFNQLLARHGFEEVAHRYKRWNSGPDQFGHVARYTGKPIDPTRFYEDPEEVGHYLRVINPLRSAVYYPLHGGYLRRLSHVRTLAKRTVEVLRTEPLSVPRRVRDYIAWRRSLR